MQAGKIIFFLSLAFSASIFASASVEQDIKLDSQQIKNFRSWIVTIVEDQITRGANPRWNHRDCAGLFRFAIHEALATHNDEWRKSNGFIGRPLPADLELTTSERNSLKQWKVDDDNKKSHFAKALILIQKNTHYLGKTIEKIEPGDLLFFDQGDDQHLMIWTGRRIVYHNGQRANTNRKSKRVASNNTISSGDEGLRALTFDQLMNFSDSRWQPKVNNPNFIGFYRLSFLTNSNWNQQGTL